MQADVNIVYPIQGERFPKVDPSPAGPVSSAYVTLSFSTTCTGGPHEVRWGVDSDPLGEARFYDQLSGQQVWKLEGGKHRFWVESSCGQSSVEFTVG